MINFIKNISYLIIPGECIFCRKGLLNSEICDACFYHLPHVYTKHKISFQYTGVIKKIICDIKYKKKFYYNDLLAHLWCQRFGYQHKIDAIIPIPTSKQRYQQRGFNQCNLLAKAISKKCRIPVCYNLKKIKHTHAQVGLNEHRRKKNINASMQATDIPKRIAIIDDTITTGATIKEASKRLKQAGTIYIETWAIAKS